MDNSLFSKAPPSSDCFFAKRSRCRESLYSTKYINLLSLYSTWQITGFEKVTKYAVTLNKYNT